MGHGCPSGSSYYSIQPHKNFRIIFADGYDVSLLGWPEGHDLHEEAVVLLNKNNPNLVGADECPATRAAHGKGFRDWQQNDRRKSD